MTEDVTDKAGKLYDVQREALLNMHKTFLEALRHREQEILRYIAILAPALGGFVWLLCKLNLELTREAFTFAVGTVGVLFLLLVGAVYSLALGYNYRIITFQLAKLEAKALKIREFVLESWPRTLEGFEKYNPCYPPEIIKVFWLAFSVCIVGVMLTVILVPPLNKNWPIKAAILLVGAVCLYITLKAPRWYGAKFKEAWTKEEKYDKW
jgi:hypothetical protein